MSDFDIAGARKAGYSDAEIADFLGQQNGFDAAGARQSGYSDKEIIDHIVPPPSLGRQALDEVGDFAARAATTANQIKNKVVAGFGGIPRSLMEGYNWLSDADLAHGGVGAAPKIPQSVIDAVPSSEDIFNDTRKDPVTGKMDPVLGINPYVDAALQGALSTVLTGRPNFSSLTPNARELPTLLAGTTAPVTSEAAGDIFKGTPYEGAARVIGGLAGAAGGASLPSAARGVVQAGKAVAAPFTAAGRDRIIGNALVKTADDPYAAISNMESYSSPVPGFNIPAAQASRDDALMAMTNAADYAGSGLGAQKNANLVALSKYLDAAGPGADPRAFVAELAKQDAGAAARAQEALDALPPGADAATAGQAIQTALRGRYDALDTARSAAAGPLFDAARASDVPINQWPLMKWSADTIAATKGPDRAILQQARDLLTDGNGNFNRITTAADADATRKALNGLIENAPSKYSKGLLVQMKGLVDQAMTAVPEEAQAVRAFADMSRPLDVFSADKGYPFNANVVEQAPYGAGRFMLPQEKVPAAYFRPGDAGGASMKEFMASSPDPAAIDAMKSFIADKARQSGDVQAFLVKHQPAIEALDSGLARQLEDAATTASVSAGFRKSPAGKFLSNDLDSAVNSTLGAPDAARRMQSLRMSVGGSPDATQGLQQAVLNHFRSAVELPVKEAAGGAPALSADKASRWLAANRGAASNVLTADQMSALDAITRALKDQGQTAVKAAGSDTARNLASRSILEAALSNHLAATGWLAPVRGALGLARQMAGTQMSGRLMEVLQDPKLAAALMKKATPGNVQMAEPLLRSIGRGAIAAEGGEGEQ